MAEKLAGASGLVEVHVTAKPNDAARDYYKNNMLLVVARLVDMSKCYSVEAGGAATQSLGFPDRDHVYGASGRGRRLYNPDRL